MIEKTRDISIRRVIMMADIFYAALDSNEVDKAHSILANFDKRFVLKDAYDKYKYDAFSFVLTYYASDVSDIVTIIFQLCCAQNNYIFARILLENASHYLEPNKDAKIAYRMAIDGNYSGIISAIHDFVDHEVIAKLAED